MGGWGLASAAEVAVVADDGARTPVEAAAKLVPDAVGVLVRRAAVVQHTVPQHLQPRALQLRHAPALQTPVVEEVSGPAEHCLDRSACQLWCVKERCHAQGVLHG